MHMLNLILTIIRNIFVINRNYLTISLMVLRLIQRDEVISLIVVDLHDLISVDYR